MPSLFIMLPVVNKDEYNYSPIRQTYKT